MFSSKTALCVIFIAALARSEPHIEFDGESYGEVWSNDESGVTLTEYLRDGETVSKWSRMLSVQSHPGASAVADVMRPGSRRLPI